MKNKIVNVAIQVLPNVNSCHPYDIVDKAIECIKESGLKHRVCPFETVVEGKYADIMNLVEEIHEVCYNSGSNSILVYLKIQSNKEGIVSIEDKTGKYD